MFSNALSQLRNVGRVATFAGIAALAACADNKGTDLLAPSDPSLASVGERDRIYKGCGKQAALNHLTFSCGCW